MNVNFTARKTELDPKIKDRAQNKLDKLDRFFDQEAKAFVVITKERNRFCVEVTIDSRGFFFRGEETTEDAFDALEGATDTLVRQIVKHKSKLEAKLRSGSLNDSFDDYKVTLPTGQNEDDYRILKSKRFPIKPMMVEEAILQMNLLGHAFFIFRNGETEEINIVYRRKDNNYGLIEPENDLI